MTTTGMSGLSQPREPVEGLGDRAWSWSRRIEEVASVDHDRRVERNGQVDGLMPAVIHVAFALVDIAHRVELRPELAEAQVRVGEVNDFHRRM